MFEFEVKEEEVLQVNCMIKTSTIAIATDCIWMLVWSKEIYHNEHKVFYFETVYPSKFAFLNDFSAIKELMSKLVSEWK